MNRAPRDAPLPIDSLRDGLGIVRTLFATSIEPKVGPLEPEELEQIGRELKRALTWRRRKQQTLRGIVQSGRAPKKRGGPLGVIRRVDLVMYGDSLGVEAALVTRFSDSSRSMAALGIMLVFCCLSFGLQSWRQWRLTGSTGYRGISGKFGSLEWLGGVMFAVGMILAFAAPVADIAELLRRWSLPLRSLLDAFALVFAAIGIAGAWWTQAAMGVSWRIGVQKDETTELIERGPFRWIRNPFFSFMLVAATAVVLLLPNVVSCAAWLSLAAAAELQVRCAEEPYLRRIHGPRYARYCARVGRFVPGFGRNAKSS